MITIDDFKKVEIRIGEIVSVEKIEGSSKLLKLSVHFGEDSPRQVLSGIGPYFLDSSVLIGRKCAFVTNLEPRQMMGFESQAMILATGEGENFSLFEVPQTIPRGSLVK